MPAAPRRGLIRAVGAELAAIAAAAVARPVDVDAPARRGIAVPEAGEAVLSDLVEGGTRFDITDTREKLFTYVKAGVLAPGSIGKELPHSTDPGSRIPDPDTNKR